MAESIAYGLAQNIVKGLGSQAIQEIGSAWGVNKEVKRLENTVSAIKALLPHAEQLQLSNPDVRLWLSRIKDAVYEADDIIDDFLIQAVRKKLMLQDRGIKRVTRFASSSNPVVLRFKMARRIKGVRENLKNILDDQSFGLEKRFLEPNGDPTPKRDQTHSYIPEGKVVGRDVEREEIIDLLLDPSEEDSLTVIPIKGMGGIGKTTLAQLVYNDERVDEYFMKRMWVCVSDEFDVREIVQKIIKSATDDECPALEMDQLQSRLRELLRGTKFLLVLDDIWNEDVEKWHSLKDLLTGGLGGSKMIVTTRNERVGSIMESVSTYELLELSYAHCWELFKGRAFKEGEEQVDPELVGIGRDIVKKCGGVPLAATTLGGLCYKAEKQVWEDVRNNDVWKLEEERNGILRALRISYNHLPFYLKQCFAYCSIYPKDFVIEKHTLIQLWIAQGFIHSSDENRSLEDIGSGYVKDLMRKSFFQEPVVDDYDNLITFKMHDLVHDLAKSVAGVECFTVCRDKEEKIPDGVRHLSCYMEVSSFILESLNAISKPSNIRTLMVGPRITLLSKLKFLRVLQFDDHRIDHLPNSIFKLKHLRYLEVFSFSVKALPESISNLQSLQVLNLGCPNLKKLPRSIRKMSALRHIALAKTVNLKHMPLGLKDLVSLQTLSFFIVSKDNTGCELNELNGLMNLGGRLQIQNLGNLKDPGECAKTNLKSKSKLRRLELSWDEEGGESINRVEISCDVLENLEPHPNLQELILENYLGTMFPPWLMEPSLPNVVEVNMHGCRKCEQLPPFSRLPSLKVLVLCNMDTLRYFEGKLEQSQKEWFPSLRSLSLQIAPNLESWTPTENEELLVSFPSLVDLVISYCPKLKNMPRLPTTEEMVLSGCRGDLVHSVLTQKVSPVSSSNSSLVTLKSLEINGCGDLQHLPEDVLQGLISLTSLTVRSCMILTSLSFGIHHLPSLQNLTIQWLPELMYLPEGLGSLTSLQELQISECHELRRLPDGMQHLCSLKSLNIYKCSKLVALSEGLANLTSLQKLTIEVCRDLQSLPDGMQHLGSLKFLKINSCTELITFPEGMENLTSLQELEICNCPVLQSSPEVMRHFNALKSLTISPYYGAKSWPNWLGHLPSLRELTIFCSLDLPFLPQQIQQLTALQYLSIKYSEGLTTLPEWMKKLTSLQTLEIHYCRNLQVLPEWMFRMNTTIRKLWMDECDHLTPRYNKKTGKDWHKIAHIKEVYVNRILQR